MPNLPDEIINKCIMMSIPTYAFMHELKTTRIIIDACPCEGCTEKHYFGCYHSKYDLFNYPRKPTYYIMALKNIFLADAFDS